MVSQLNIDRKQIKIYMCSIFVIYWLILKQIIYKPGSVLIVIINDSHSSRIIIANDFKRPTQVMTKTSL